MLNLEHLQQFSAFHRLGTLSRVAEELLISQPTLTRNMQKLEADFGVPLFARAKNRLVLNETGRLAAEQAELVLAQCNTMLDRTRRFDKAQHTVAVGACAVMPLQHVLGQLTGALPGTTVAGEIRPQAELIAGLQSGVYQLAVLLAPLPGPDFCCRKLREEHLMFCLPQGHPLAGRERLALADMDGENLLMLSEIGFWSEAVRQKMPRSRFLVQTERYTLEELVHNSVLPCFCTDWSLQTGRDLGGRVAVPITDPEVNATFYLACKRADQHRFPLMAGAAPAL